MNTSHLTLTKADRATLEQLLSDPTLALHTLNATRDADALANTIWLQTPGLLSGRT